MADEDPYVESEAKSRRGNRGDVEASSSAPTTLFPSLVSLPHQASLPFFQPHTRPVEGDHSFRSGIERRGEEEASLANGGKRRVDDYEVEEGQRISAHRSSSSRKGSFRSDHAEFSRKEPRSERRRDEFRPEERKSSRESRDDATDDSRSTKRAYSSRNERLGSEERPSHRGRVRSRDSTRDQSEERHRRRSRSPLRDRSTERSSRRRSRSPEDRKKEEEGPSRSRESRREGWSRHRSRSPRSRQEGSEEGSPPRRSRSFSRPRSPVDFDSRSNNQVDPQPRLNQRPSQFHPDSSRHPSCSSNLSSSYLHSSSTNAVASTSAPGTHSPAPLNSIAPPSTDLVDGSLGNERGSPGPAAGREDRRLVPNFFAEDLQPPLNAEDFACTPSFLISGLRRSARRGDFSTPTGVRELIEWSGAFREPEPRMCVCVGRFGALADHLCQRRISITVIPVTERLAALRIKFTNQKAKNVNATNCKSLASFLWRTL